MGVDVLQIVFFRLTSDSFCVAMPFESGRSFGKYQKLLIPLETLEIEARRLFDFLTALQRAYQTEYLTEAEYTAYFVLLFSYHRAFASEMAMGRKSRKCLELESFLSWFDRQNEEKPGGLILVLDSLQLKGMPRMIWQILARWLRGEVRLKLADQPVTSTDMLNAMAQGFRYVSLDMRSAMTGRPVAQTRDAFEFVLHDLGHAHAFFKPEYDFEGQALFFQDLQNDLKKFEKYQNADNQFAVALDYCLSDMNSHPMHLRQYIEGIVVELFLRMRQANTSIADQHTWSEQAMRDFLASLKCLSRVCTV